MTLHLDFIHHHNNDDNDNDNDSDTEIVYPSRFVRVMWRHLIVTSLSYHSMAPVAKRYSYH